MINYWSQPTTTPMLHLWHKGHIVLVLFFSGQWHIAAPCGILMSHYSSSPIERRWGNGFTYEDPQQQLSGQLSRPLVPSAASLGRFQLNSPNVWDILIPLSHRLSLHPHLWSPDSGRVHPWIKPSLCSLCVLVFYMEIRGAVGRGLAFLCLFRCHIERVCY